MGLDMYLSVRKSVWRNEFVKPELSERYDSVVKSAKIDDLIDKDNCLASVRATTIYWRKANQIHGWFVENVQNGVDNCDEYDVPVEKLKALRDLCVKVKTENKPELLPPCPGFFFGSYDIDEWYWADIDHTITELNRVLDALPNADAEPLPASFTYTASW